MHTWFYLSVVAAIPVVVATAAILATRRTKALAVAGGTVTGFPSTNRFAIASVLVVWVSSIAGLILGHVALTQIRADGGWGSEMASTSVLVGWVATLLKLLVGFFIFLVFAISPVG